MGVLSRVVLEKKAENAIFVRPVVPKRTWDYRALKLVPKRTRAEKDVLSGTKVGELPILGSVHIGALGFIDMHRMSFSKALRYYVVWAP